MTIVAVNKFHRNAACTCGSGKKMKKCCQSANEYHYIDNSPEKDAEMAVDNDGEVVENT